MKDYKEPQGWHNENKSNIRPMWNYSVNLESVWDYITLYGFKAIFLTSVLETSNQISMFFL